MIYIGTKLAELLEAEATQAQSNPQGYDIDTYAMEQLGNAINLPDGVEVAFTSDGFIIEGKDADAQAQAILEENDIDTEEDAEVFINQSVWEYLKRRPVYVA
jgi:hypothetical protein